MLHESVVVEARLIAKTLLGVPFTTLDGETYLFQPVFGTLRSSSVDLLPKKISWGVGRDEGAPCRLNLFGRYPVGDECRYCLH